MFVKIASKSACPKSARSAAKRGHFKAQFALATLAALLLLGASLASAGGNKGNKKGGEEDIIMYNGNIVLRGDKSGGSIVMASSQPHNEEVEFAPSFFGEMGAFRR